jgi:gliding motility-associated-like protein
MNNGNLIFTGTYKDNAGNSFVSLTEASQNGGIINQKYFNNSSTANINRGSDVIILADNSLLITAKNQQNGEIYNIKTNINHNVLCGESQQNNIYTAPDLNVNIEFNYQTPILENLTDANLSIVNLNLNDTSLCYFTDTMNLNLGNDTTLCAGTLIKLKSNIIGNYTYLWSTGSTNPEITVSTSGTYWLRVIGCDTVIDTIKIHFTKGLSINYNIKPLVVDLGQSITFANNTTAYQNYYWECGDGNQYTQNHFDHIYQNYGIYYPVIHITDSFNCQYSDTSKVEVRFATIYIPNSFTPNGDGINELFEIKGEAIKTYTLYIYNRWGELVYTAQNHGWDGSHNGNQCQPGTYNYKAEITDIFGRNSVRKGSINLIK